MALNVTTAVFGENCNTATASPSLAQWDKGQVLQISGVDLPDAYQVEFSTVYTRNAIPVIGNASGVQVPNELLQRSAPITACVVLHSTANSRDTEYWVTIHITPRKPPETITPDPEQQDVIDQAIAALQDGTARAEAAATAAAGSATEADGNAENAEAWAVGQRAGEDVPDTDPTYRNNAKYYAGAAEAAAEEAGQHEASWETWVQRAESAADDAEGSARAAAGSKADAEAAAQTATQQATAAGNSATAAAGSAAEARQTVDGGVGAINTARDGALSAIGTARTNAVGNVNQAGAAQVTAVNQAGATQAQAVEDKGAEVLDSIPQDYSELVDDVADLSRQLSDVDSALTSIQNIEPIPYPIEYTLGKAWEGNVGYPAAVITNSNRLCNVEPILLPQGSYTINVNDGYRTSYRTLDSNNIILTDSGWITTNRNFEADGETYYAFSGGKLADASVTLNEFEDNVKLICTPELYKELAEIPLSAHKQDVLNVVSIVANNWVEIDTSARTLTLPADTSVFANDAPNTRYNFQTQQVISLTPSDTNSIKVVFNPNTQEFSSLAYNTKIPDNCLLLAYVNISGNGNAVMTCRYKINGNPFGMAELGNKADQRNVLCVIAPPQLQPYVKVDTKIDPSAPVIIFPSDTSIYDIHGTNNRYNLASEQRVTCSSNQSTSHKIIFTPSTGLFSSIIWKSNIPSGSLFVAAFRTTPPTLTISCPYAIDDKMYGIDAAKATTQISFDANIKSVNHRGYNSVAPENTLPAFKLSRKNGFKYVETDVRFTSDNVPVLLHDTTINRTARNTDGTEISSTINIADITYEQALNYDFGIWKNSSYAGTKIPTLAQFVGLCRNIGLTPRIELNVLTVANAVTMFNVIDSYGMARKVEYNCNDITVAQKFLELEPSATIVYGMSSYNQSTVEAVGALKTSNNTIIINMVYTAVTAELIDKCKSLGIDLEVWTVNSENAIKALDPYISGVTSDSINAAVIMYNQDID